MILLSLTLWTNLAKSQSLSDSTWRKINYLIDHREQLQDSVKYLENEIFKKNLEISTLNKDNDSLEESIILKDKRLSNKDNQVMSLQTDLKNKDIALNKAEFKLKLYKIGIPISFGLGITTASYVLLKLK